MQQSNNLTYLTAPVFEGTTVSSCQVLEDLSLHHLMQLLPGFKSSDISH